MLATGKQREIRPGTLSKLMLVVALLAGSMFLAPTAQAQDDDASSLLPDGAAERVASIYAELGIANPLAGAVGAAINPDDYVCGTTDFGDRIDQIFGATNPAALDQIFYFGAHIWPEVYTVLFDNDPSDTEIGANGEYAQEQVKRHRDNRRFWDAPIDDVQLHGMHGYDIADDAKMVPVVTFLFGAPPDVAEEIVDLMQALIENDPTVGYDHPLFSLNAFAVSFGGQEVFPGFGVIPDKIVMGDGLLGIVDDLGLGGIGPDLIHAHEFAHHVQFEIGAFDTDITDPAEATRRTELMADAFAGYNLAHAQGASFQTKRIADAVVLSFNAGSCDFDSGGHHGTPNQRASAAAWGADLAQATLPRGKIISPHELLALFEAELPLIVAPDAG